MAPHPDEEHQDRFSVACQYFKSGDFAAALELALEVICQDPCHGDALQLAALSHAALGNLSCALVYQRQAVQTNEHEPQYHYNLGVVHQQGNQTELAMLSYQRCLWLKPDHCDALWNQGELLRLNEHFRQAVACFEKIRSVGGEYPGLDHRLAVAYHGMGRNRAAARCFERALSKPQPDHELTRWEYAHVLLSEGYLDKGWELYESRCRIEGSGRIAIHHFDVPRWQGESLAGRSLLVHGEQGLGDEIMFASRIPAMIEEGCDLTIACHPALVRLFEDSFPGCRVLPHQAGAGVADLGPKPAVDFEAPIGSLCRWRGPRRTDEPAPPPYLLAHPQQTQTWSTRLERWSKGTGKLTVGLMWSANPAISVDWGSRRARQKSVPIEIMAMLERVTDRVRFVSLQNRDSGAQAAHAPGLEMLDFHDELHDLADTAALAACLDLVISVDTSVAHLAGAMGLPVWVLLKHHPDWRWLNRGETSYWYDSARIYRQQTRGDWRPLMSQVLMDLEKLSVA